ncbi:MAG: sporulation protein YqfD [Bacillota bacterium]
MFINRLWALCIGYLAIRFRGQRVERFINLCLQNDIPVWDVYTTRNGTVVGKTSIDGFKAMRPIARRSRVSVRILARRGLPFLLNKLWKRTAFVIGALLFIVSLHILGSIIWFIDVQGTEELAPAVVLEAAAELGVRRGAWRNSLVPADLSRRLVLKLPELSWAALDLKGSSAIIQVVEKKVVTVEPRRIGDIVAQKSGVISKIIATQGKSLVKRGDTVEIGDVLISGTVQADEDSQIRYVHAEGIAEARITYEATGVSHLRRTVQRRTGQSLEVDILVLGQRELIVAGPRETPFALYEEECQTLPLIWRNLGAPVEHKVKAIYELVAESEVVSFEQARQEALERAQAAVMSLLPADVVVEDLSYETKLLADENTVQVRATITTIESIGEFDPY